MNVLFHLKHTVQLDLYGFEEDVALCFGVNCVVAVVVKNGLVFVTYASVNVAEYVWDSNVSMGTETCRHSVTTPR